MMKKVLIMLLCICLLIVLSIGAYFFKNPKVVNLIPGNYHFLGFEAMVEQADIIAIVETKERYRQRKKIEGSMRTDVKVKKIIKSNDSSIKEGDMLPLNESFYLEWFRILMSSDYKPLTRNESYLLFLGIHPTSGSYYVMNQNGGRYQITGKEMISRPVDFEKETWEKYEDAINEVLKK